MVDTRAQVAGDRDRVIWLVGYDRLPVRVFRRKVSWDCNSYADDSSDGGAAIDRATDVSRDGPKRCSRVSLLVAMRASPSIPKNRFATRLSVADQSRTVL